VELQCPLCKTLVPATGQEQPYRPFCSQRCKLADLHNWLSGAYSIDPPLDPGEVTDDDFKLGD
jgi:hypothetical protein